MLNFGDKVKNCTFLINGITYTWLVTVNIQWTMSHDPISSISFKLKWKKNERADEMAIWKVISFFEFRKYSQNALKKAIN